MGGASRQASSIRWRPPPSGTDSQFGLHYYQLVQGAGCSLESMQVLVAKRLSYGPVED